jgi:hypothetical protein
VLLNQEEQALLGLEVIIKSRQRHAGGTGKIAHGSAFVSFFAEDFGSVGEDFGESLIVASNRDGSGTMPSR